MYYVLKTDKVIEYALANGSKAPGYMVVPAGAIFEAEDTDGPVRVTFQDRSITISQDYLRKLKDNLELLEHLGGKRCGKSAKSFV